MMRISPKKIQISKLENYTSSTMIALKKISKFSLNEVRLTSVLKMVLFSFMAFQMICKGMSILATVYTLNK